MTPLVINLGKTGDIVSLLPPLRVMATEAGERIKVMVAKKYASVLEGCSYVDPVVWNGDWLDLRGAYDEARKSFDQIIVAQQAGPAADMRELSHGPAWPKGVPVPKEGAHAFEDSFVKQAWRCLGKQALRRQMPPMVFDRRDPAREAALLEKLGVAKKKVLLVSCGGQTSPFKYKELLMHLLTVDRDGRQWKVIDLDEVEAERFYDLLGLFERAKCLVAVDSAPLHLARAVPTLPVVAIVQDQPTAWHGSPWQPNHVVHCRYGDFPERALECVRAVEGHSANGIRLGRNGGRAFILVYHGRNPVAQVERQQWTGNHLDWVETECQKGSLGRDGGGFPFLKDVIGMATMRAAMNDMIVLTRSDTCLARVPEGPCWSFRTTRTANGENWAGIVDMMAFPRSWYEANLAHIPDFIMGPDSFWSRAMMELLKATGGVELEGGCFNHG